MKILLSTELLLWSSLKIWYHKKLYLRDRLTAEEGLHKIYVSLQFYETCKIWLKWDLDGVQLPSSPLAQTCIFPNKKMLILNWKWMISFSLWKCVCIYILIHTHTLSIRCKSILPSTGQNKQDTGNIYIFSFRSWGGGSILLPRRWKELTEQYLKTFAGLI